MSRTVGLTCTRELASVGNMALKALALPLPMNWAISKDSIQSTPIQYINTIHYIDRE